MGDYHTYRQFTVATRGRYLEIHGKPGVWGWDGLDPGTEALLDAAQIEPEDEVLDLGCGTGVIGAVAATATAARVTLIDSSLAAVRCARRTVEANELSNAEVRLADEIDGLVPGSCDVVLSHLPRGREVQERLIDGAAWVLRPGGRLYIAAHKRAGVKGAIAYATDRLGRCGVVRQKKGRHVALAVKPEGLTLDPPGDGFVGRTVKLDGVETALVSKPGVFAWDRLDDGTRALVGAMEIGPDDRVLDLGCGTGLAGVAAARRLRLGSVTLVDVDVRAVTSSRRTLRANGISCAEVICSDGASEVVGRRFDVVVTNPPFHQGVGVDEAVADQFVREAATVLRQGGRLYLVANRFLRYVDRVVALFDDVTTCYDDGRYRVLSGLAKSVGSV